LAGSVVIDAVGDGFTSNSQTFSVTAGPPTKLVITSASFTATASTTTRNPFTVTLEDTNGNATTNASAITVNLAVSPTSGTSFYAASSGGSAVTSVTLPANTATVTAYLVDFTSGSDTITVSVTGGSPASGTQVETINPGTASKIVLSGCTTSIASTATCVATATLEDQNNNTVSSYNGAVAFNQTNTGGSVTGLTDTTTFTNGVANVTLTGVQAGSVVIDAVGDGFTSNSQTFSVTFGSATQVVLSGCGSDIASNATCVATATLEDTNGNTVTNYSGAVTFNQTNSGGGTVTGTGATTFTNGVANKTLTGKVAGLVTIDAVGDGFTSDTTSFNVTFGAATKVVLSGTCTGTITSCVATATLEDTNGNTVTNYSGGVVFSQTTGSGSVTGLTGTTSFTNGVANVTLTGNKVGPVTIHAVGDGFTSATASFTVTFGAATQVVLSGCGSDILSNATCVATATLEDTNGNTVTNYSGAVTFNQTNSGGGTVTGTGATTFTNGVASKTLTGKVAGPVTIDAVGDGFTSGTTSFNVTPGAANKLVITSAAFTSPHSNTTRNPFTVTLEDVNGNATTSASAITVNLAVSPASGTSFYAVSSGGGTVTSVTLLANNSTVTAYLVDSSAGTDTITVSVTGGSPSSGTQIETIT
jgi:hypothetical protein